MEIAENKDVRTAVATADGSRHEAALASIRLDALTRSDRESCRFGDAQAEMRIRHEERDRIARELHDSTSQLLVTLGAQLMRLKQVPRATIADGFVDIVGELGAIFAQLHASVDSLAEPELLNPEDLVTDLEVMAAEFALQTAVTVSTDLGELPVGVSPRLARALFRVSQEALANACRHGKARRIWLSLTADGQSITLRVADDGVGFAAPALGSIGGRGISNMSSRIKELGGTLTIRNLEVGALVEARISLCSDGEMPMMSPLGQVG